MQGNQIQPGRVRRTVNDLVMAEMFLLQATIESANAIGEGIGQISRHISGDEERDWDGLGSVLYRTADEALEPYATRFRYLREMISDGH